MKKIGIQPLCEVCAIVTTKALNIENVLGNESQKQKYDMVTELQKVVTQNGIIDASKIEFNQIEIPKSVPLSVLKNLPKFCAKKKSASKTRDSNLLDYGVFTDEEGSRLYMYSIEVPLNDDLEIREKSNCTFIKSYKLCFLSSHRYFKLMKDILQALFIVCVRSSYTTIDDEVQSVVSLLSNVFVPPKGHLDVSFEYDKKTFFVKCPTIHGLRDVPWPLPFVYFRHKTIVEIIVSIITEQQVVFVGNDQATRVLIIECILAYIYPMEWIAPYLPVLIEELYGFLGALGYFIFGADSSVLEELPFYENIIVVNIDQGTIKYGKGATCYVVDDCLTSMFEERLPKNSFSYLGSCINKIYKSEEEILQSKNEFDFNLDARIFLSMQCLLLDIYKGLLAFQMSSKMQLNMRRISGCSQDQLTHLQLHLKKTMMRSSLEYKLINPYLSRQYLNTFQNVKEKPITDALTEIMISMKRKKTISLGPKIDSNLMAVEVMLSESKDVSIRSSLLYIKALVLLRKMEVIAAFQSINKIFETSIHDFPALEVHKIFKNVEREPAIYKKLLDQSFMKQAVWAPYLTDRSQANLLINVSNQYTYTYLEVPEILMQFGVTRKYEVSKRIFNSLKSDSETLQGQHLKNFCDIWKRMKLDLEHTYLPLLTESKEKIVKISKRVVDGKSQFHLVSSTDKIYFFDRLSGQVCDFINLDEIVETSLNGGELMFKLKSRKQKTIGNIIDGSIWLMVIEELIAAMNDFKRTKNHNALVDARADILIFESFNQLDQLDQPDECIENGGYKSTFYTSIKENHSEFLNFRENSKKDGHVFNDFISAGNHYHDNVLCRFSPNSEIKETIDVIISSDSQLYIGTRLCNLYKVSSKSLEVEDQVSLMLTNNEKWSIYDMIQVDGCLWVSLNYNKTEKSLCIVDIHEFSNFQILKLNHTDNIVGMKSNDKYCFITSADGFTSMWSITEKNCIAIVDIGNYLVLSTTLNGNELIHSVKGGFSVLKDSASTYIATGFTLTKFIICNNCIYGIDKAASYIIRCFSLLNYEHLKDLDVLGTTIESDTCSFSSLNRHHDTHLICATRDCSLLVYNIKLSCFVKVMKNAHNDLISSIATTVDGNIVTGARSKDGSIIFWVNMFD